VRSSYSPSRDDPVVGSLSEVVGGPLGRHAGHHPWWTPLRVALAVLTVVLAAGVVARAPCVDASARDADWTHSRLCHSDVARTYVEGGLAELTRPWTGDEASRARHDAPGLAAVPGYLAWGTAWLTQQVTGSPDLSERYRVPVDEVADRADVRREVQVFTALTAIVLAALALLAAWLLGLAGRDRPWAVAAWAASPVLLLTWPAGWDLLAAVAVAGVLAAAPTTTGPGRPVLAGALIGVGASVVPAVAVLLLALVVVAATGRPTAPGSPARPLPGSSGRDGRERPLDTTVPSLTTGGLGWGDVVAAWVAAVLAWALVNVPAWAAGPEDWVEGAAGALRGPAGTGSPWLVVEQATNRAVPGVVLAAVAVGVVLLVAGLLVVLARRGRRTPSLAEAGLVLLVAVLVLSPAHPVTHALVLLPLAALAVPRWRDLLLWQGGELVAWALTGFHRGGALAPATGTDEPFYWLAVVVRVAAELWLVAVVVARLLPSGSAAPSDGRGTWPARAPGELSR
jgi:uncharacterized membrane protein